MERLMQYVWGHRLWPPGMLATTDGRRITVFDPGRLNNDAGPDFFNAKIAIDGQTWVGNVEIHVKASDWHRHGHDGDPAYGNVILHVVDVNDTLIEIAPGQTIPQLIMSCAPDLNRHYANLVSVAASDIACRKTIAETDGIFLRDWLDALAMERLHEKADRIAAYVKRFNGDWEQAAFVAIARSLGAGINGDVFERLAMGVPLKSVARHNDSLLMTEAFLFGQSGLLANAPQSAYVESLIREYKFLKNKFGIEQPQGMLWKMARMRPAAFPHRRIALLARMLHRSTRFLSKLVAMVTADSAAEADNLFNSVFGLELDGFWADHFTFGEASPTSSSKSAGVGKTALTTLLINAVIPVTFAYGNHIGDFQIADMAMERLHGLAPENNNIVRGFVDAGLPCLDAADSQAIIQLRRAYCEQRKCLYCRLGHRTLSKAAVRSVDAVI